jgi:sugar O-acyltransferase (sialic acid O-acetyltransferase NeuD family)
MLVAASGLARETLAVLARTRSHDVLGILDDDAASHGTTVSGVPVLGGLEEAKASTAQLILCVGKGVARRSIVRRLGHMGVGPDRYATVVHPSVEVPPSCVVGAGSILLAGVVLTADVSIGDHVVLMPGVTLTHDDVVEDFATVCSGVALGGSVVVGSGAYLGMNASVREGVRVGADATLGMGSVLLRDLPDRAVWAGVPARPVSGHPTTD